MSADWEPAIGAPMPARLAMRSLPSLRSGNPLCRFRSGASQQVRNLCYDAECRVVRIEFVKDAG
jgi:hypothetical protein